MDEGNLHDIVQLPNQSNRPWPWGWKTMWVIAMFDLPTHDKKARRAYTTFRKELLKDGFSMMQYSVYVRHCTSLENSHRHIQKISHMVPDEGEVRFLVTTDRQFEKMITFVGKKIVKRSEPEPTQLQLF